MQFKTQKEMFDWIWDHRPHKSELSGDPLIPKGQLQWHWQFAHILAKGQYPKFKLNAKNIMLMTPKEHERQETFHKFIEKRDELKREYYKKFYNKKFEE